MGSDDKRHYEEIRYDYTPDELRVLGLRLAQECQGMMDLEARKKEITAELGSQVKAAENRVSELTTRLNAGYEMREEEVLVVMDEPRPGMKSIVRISTNRPLREEAMTAAEMQRGFGFTA
jgi:hypothetical protein